MSLASFARRPADYVGPFTYTRGNYRIGNTQVPYYSTTMTIAQAVNELRLARDLALGVDRTGPVTIEELFQREIDEDRAKGAIATYLKSPDQTKFFNAFTVVLLPVATDGSERVLDAYDDDPDQPEPDDPALTTTSVGPVLLEHTLRGDLGYIRWNRELVRPVILDGQHRFVALQDAYQDTAFRPSLRPDETAIPVLLLVLDPRVGYQTAATADGTLLRACRKIFIDLNRHAEKVPSARNYLLDDVDPLAVAMRSTIETTLRGPADNNPRKVPLALVDWYGESAKFDRGLHSTTVLALYETVRVIMGRPPASTEHDALRKYVGEVSSRLWTEWDARWRPEEVLARIEAAERREEPFAFTHDELGGFAASFAAGPGQAIIRVLLDLEPYRAVMDRYRHADLLDAPGEIWLGSNEIGKRAIERTGDVQYRDSAAVIAREARERYPYAFLVIFQRAMMLSAERLASAGSLASEAFLELDPASDQDEWTILDEWLRRANSRIVPFLDSATFWSGTGIKPDGSVDYSQRGVAAVQGLTTLAVLMDAENFLTGSDPDPTARAGLPLGPFRHPLGQDLSTDSALRAVVHDWVTNLFSTIGPGRAGGTRLNAVRRSAASMLRNAVRRNVLSAGVDDTAEVDPAAAALVSDRLTAVLEHIRENADGAA
jgi:hypothetical protein